MQERPAIILEVGFSIWPARLFYVVDRIQQRQLLQVIVAVQSRRAVGTLGGRQGHVPFHTGTRCVVRNLHQFMSTKGGDKTIKICVQDGGIYRKPVVEALFNLSGFKTTDYSVPYNSARTIRTEISSISEIHDDCFIIDNLAYDVFVSHPIERHPPRPQHVAIGQLPTLTFRNTCGDSLSM